MFQEFLQYLGTQDARFTIYGAILGLVVVYVVRSVIVVLNDWRKVAAKSGKKGVSHFLEWLNNYYYRCPRWMRMCSKALTRLMTFFGYKRGKKHTRRHR